MYIYIKDGYHKFSFAETKPVREVKEGIRVVFEGEGGVSPDGFDFR